MNDVKVAAQRTLDTCVAAIDPEFNNAALPHARLTHLHKMNRRIQSGELAESKAQRWLGWLQAVAYLGGGATHEKLRQINEES